MKARTNRAVPVHLEQVAYAAVYLLSDLATDVQGQMFTVDRGGYL
jgi:enoyl-[acyl-carrier-protein] reductase (NADH)